MKYKIHMCLEQRSLDWHKVRAGKVTGTSLSAAITSGLAQKQTKKSLEARNNLKYKLVSQLMTEPDMDGFVSQSMQHGIDCEPLALDYLRDKHGLCFEEVGFVESLDVVGLGFSPDGILKARDAEITNGLEIKCPNSHTHVRYICQDKLPDDYMFQVLAPFIITDCEAWTFCSYDPRNYERPMFIKAFTRQNIESRFCEKFPDFSIGKCRDILRDFTAEVRELHKKLTF